MSPLQRHIHRLTSWHFWSATGFEIVKAAHQFALFATVGPSKYGHIGTIFSMIYLSAHIWSFEGGNALIPFANGIAHHPNRATYVYRYLITPQITLHFIGALITHIFIGYHLLPHPKPLFLCLIISITVLEGWRMSMRTVIHTMTDSRPTIIFESTLSGCYFIFVWGSYHFLGMPLNLQSILIPFLFSSIMGTIYLTNAIANFPTVLPKLKNPILPTPTNNIRTRLSLTMLHLPKNIFSANFLTPFFAATSGLHLAGFVKVCAEIAQAIKAIIKSSIGLSANTIFNAYITNRAQAFNMLWSLLTNGLIAAGIISVLGAGPYLFTTHHNATGALLICFSMICMLDYLYILYERFFIVADSSHIIGSYRVTEAIASAALLWWSKGSPVFIMIGLIGLRSISLTTTIIKAHKLWRITPRMKIYWRKLGYATMVGCLLAMVTTYCKNNCGHKGPRHEHAAPSSPLSESQMFSE